MIQSRVGKSAGIIVEPTSFTGATEVLGTPIKGSEEEIAAGLRKFGVGGFTRSKSCYGRGR